MSLRPSEIRGVSRIHEIGWPSTRLFPTPLLPSHTLSLRSSLPLIQLGVLGERCKFPQQVRAELAAQ